VIFDGSLINIPLLSHRFAVKTTSIFVQLKYNHCALVYPEKHTDDHNQPESRAMILKNDLFPRGLMFVTIALALFAGMSSGLARLGWQMDPVSRDWIVVHGPLMIGGFLGTLISLERAVALSSRVHWSLMVPIVNTLGAIGLLLMPTALAGKVLLTVGSTGLLGLFAVMLRLHFSRDVMIMAAGSLCWLIGNLLWLSGQPIFQVVHLWTAFLILTIVGERLELSRVRRLTRLSEYLLVASVIIYLAGVLLTTIQLDMGVRLFGVGAVLVALWLLRYDIARRTIQQQGLPRYIAACLLPGYVWLGFGGLMAISKGAIYAGPDYAVILHAFLLGFVFSMIFGHMPIILPALTGLRVNYTALFYAPLLLLHLSLLFRTYGSMSLNFSAQQWGGLLNVCTILLFIGLTVMTVLRSRTTTAALNKAI
jgi:hypothetical protein